MKSRGPNLSLTDAGRAMGFEGSPEAISQKAKRVIEAKERKIRKRIMLRAGGNGTGVRYVVTRWALMRWLPEYFDRRDLVVLGFRKYTKKLEEKLAKHDALIEHLGDLIAKVLDKVESLEANES